VNDIFRREAIEYHRAGPQSDGEILHLVPGWALWTYRLLLSVLAVGAVFAVLADVPEYAEGPALIRADGAKIITAAAAGIVETIDVHPGDHVEAGRTLLVFRSDDERAQVSSIRTEFDAALVRMLANPRDQAAREALGTLRAQRELVSARFAERQLRAPASTTVGDIRVKVGQSVGPGDTLMSLASGDATFSVLALLPGDARPSLQEGQPLRIELSGYQYVYKDLTIQRVDNGIIGPSEARRILGAELGDAVQVSGGVVLARACLPDAAFTSGGTTYNYFDGMRAAARVRLRSESLAAKVIPGLKLLAGRR
jgi:multidrug efflux pump subunit AcrA (membrane-fusion protein)